jgi:hypothetical protein
LVDGAVTASTPVSVAAMLGATRVIVLPCGFTCVGTSVGKHALGRAMHAITLIFARQLRFDFDRRHIMRTGRYPIQRRTGCDRRMLEWNQALQSRHEAQLSLGKSPRTPDQTFQ